MSAESLQERMAENHVQYMQVVTYTTNIHVFIVFLISPCVVYIIVAFDG